MRKSTKEFGYTVEETKPGELTIRCEYGNPYTDSDAVGMFCSASPCKCRDEDLEFEEQLKTDPEYAFLRDLLD